MQVSACRATTLCADVQGACQLEAAGECQAEENNHSDAGPHYLGECDCGGSTRPAVGAARRRTTDHFSGSQRATRAKAALDANRRPRAAVPIARGRHEHVRAPRAARAVLRHVRGVARQRKLVS